MNTRGLMELVVLNIGYDLGVLTPEIFSMMVLMALVTTFMTGPAIDFVNFIFKKKIKHIPAVEGGYQILFSFGPPLAGIRLLQLVNQLFGKNNSFTSQLYILHLALISHLMKPKFLRKKDLSQY